MHYKILAVLAVVFISLWSSPLEAKRHSRTQISFNFSTFTPAPVYQQRYVVQETYYEPHYQYYPQPAPVYVRPVPPPQPQVYYEQVYVYPPQPTYYYPYGW